jgi:putative two-component system response regulator
MAVMRTHTTIGETVCKPLKSFALVLPIIRHHHEKQDGIGYPDGLRGDQVPLVAHVLQLVDVYDALITGRPYKGSFTHSEALAIMEKEVAAGWWDSDFYAAFRQLAKDEFASNAEMRRRVNTTPLVSRASLTTGTKFSPS